MKKDPEKDYEEFVPYTRPHPWEYWAAMQARRFRELVGPELDDWAEAEVKRRREKGEKMYYDPPEDPRYP